MGSSGKGPAVFESCTGMAGSILNERLSVLVFAWAWHHERGENFALNSPRFQPFPCEKAL